MKAYTMKAYKGFNKDMTCRGFKYEVGKEYETDKAELCKSGFHACENPLDCMNYYSPVDGCAYHEVELDGTVDKAKDDSKVAATKIKIGARLAIADIVKAAIAFIFSKAHAATSGDFTHAATSGDYAHAATSGDRAHAATSGDFTHAATSGDRANAATSGDGAHAATSGDRAHAATSGDYANAEVSGRESIAAALGCGGKARGALGCWLVLAERDELLRILGVRAVKVDGEEYKPGTWYALSGGKVVEAEEGGAE